MVAERPRGFLKQCRCARRATRHGNQRRRRRPADHAALGPVRVVASPLHLSATPATLRRSAPRLGADSAEVLGELGYDAAGVAALRTAGLK